jgi:hypothetical protein
MMCNQAPTNIKLPKPFCEWSLIEHLEIGASLSFHTDLYGRLHDAVTYRVRRDGKKFTRRASADVLIVWRIG